MEPEIPYPQDRNGLIHRRAAIAAGFTDNQLAGSVRRGELVRLARGVFCAAPRTASTAAEALDHEYRLRCLAEASTSRGGSALSHQSAAAVHRLPLLKPDRRDVHMTNGRDEGGYVRASRHVHAQPLRHGELEWIDGVLVTTLERTSVDVALSVGFARALTVFDAALARGATRAAMTEMLDRRRGHATRIARSALAHADARAESVGESWSRAQMIEAGLPAPLLQSEFRVAGSVHRCDFDWSGRLIGEFDGMIKYGRLLRPGETPGEAVAREKRREDALRNTGLAVVRWDWSDLVHARMIPRVTLRLQESGLL